MANDFLVTGRLRLAAMGPFALLAIWPVGNYGTVNILRRRNRLWEESWISSRRIRA